MVTATLPPGPTSSPAVQALYSLVVPLRGMPRLRRRFGDAFTINLPGYGRTVVISDPGEVKQLFQTSQDVADNLEPNLGQMMGPGSLFALRGKEHRQQRKLLVPSFHGRRLAAFEQIVEDETVRELATWPEGRAFPTLPSMMRITINAILRAVFGAEGAEFAELRELLPRLVTLGSWLTALPIPTVDLGRWSPWGRFRAMRRRYDAVIERLLTSAAQDEDLDSRDDVLAMLVQSRYDDGSRMTHTQIADQLLALLTAGHETTATTLAWAVERLRRHPAVLRELVAEVDAGDSVLREATIAETQRIRPVIDMVGRQVKAESLQLGRWTLPRGCTVLVSIALIHDNGSVFPDAQVFDPSRFLDTKPDLHQWIPFGGGVRRCPGAAFANMEMSVVLRTMLRDFALLSTDERGERLRSRGIASCPAHGGRAVVRRRTPRPMSTADAGIARARS